MLSPNTNFAGLVSILVSFINSLVPLLVGIAIVLFMWGVVRFLYHSGDSHSKGQDKEIMLWGLVSLFVIVSVWGILRLLIATFGGASGTTYPTGAGLF